MMSIAGTILDFFLGDSVEETNELEMKQHPTVAIVGAGLAGLSCAVSLAKAGIDVRVFESTDRVGGRVRSDIVDGFTLDHGFQVLLTAYPACREWLDYSSLRLKPFEPGCLIRYQGTFSLLGDPWRRPSQLFQTTTSPIGTFGDKLRILRLRYQACRGSIDDLFKRPSQSTESRLVKDGFTPAMVNLFLRPFLGGVFLDPQLQTSSRMLEFVFRMFASGDIAIPADGMAAIPRQLAERLPRGSILLSRCVESIHGDEILLSNGERIQPQRIVVATESNAAARLLGENSMNTKWRTTTTHYFVADQSPNRRRLLMLSGDEYRRDQAHRIGTVVVLSDVAAQYAPQGKSLISVGMAESIDDAEDALPQSELKAVLTQLRGWFGDKVDRWNHLRTYRVPFGLPVVNLDHQESFRRVGKILVCGDHLETPSINGAIRSGIAAANALLKESSAIAHGAQKNNGVDRL